MVARCRPVGEALLIVWPFDGRKRELASARLELLEARVDEAFAREDDDAVVRFLVEAAAVFREHQTPRTAELVRRLRQYVARRDNAREAALAAASLDQLQPCRICKGRDFHLSHPIHVEWGPRSSPRVRFAVCAGCSHMTMWAFDLDEVRRSEYFESQLVTLDGDPPFR